MALALGSFALGADAALPTVSDAPSDGQFAENTTWYYWDAPYRNFGYIAEVDGYKNAAGTNYIVNNGVRPANDGGLWCVVGNATDGYLLYNKSASDASKVFGLNTSNGQNGLYDVANPGTNIATRFDFITGTGQSAGFYILKVHGKDIILNPSGVNLSKWGTNTTSDAASTFRFRTEAELPALPENFITTDGNNPNYFFIKNLRGADTSYDGNHPYALATGSGNLGQVSVDGSQALYSEAGALWYFTKAGEPGAVTFGNNEQHYVVPVYIKNLIYPGKTFNEFSDNQFSDEGSKYYIYERTYNEGSSVYEGYAIIKVETDGWARPNQRHAWSDEGGRGQEIIAYGAPFENSGAIFDFDAAVSSKIELTLANYIQKSKAEFSGVVKLYDMFTGGANTAIHDKINEVNTLEGVNELRENLRTNVFSKLDRKIVYMVNKGLEDANQASKYIYADKKDSYFRATDHKCVLGKWQLIHRGSGSDNAFVLRNISTDTYISAQRGDKATSATMRRRTQLEFRFVLHDNGESFVLHHTYSGSDACLTIGTENDAYLKAVPATAEKSTLGAEYQFVFEPANVAKEDIQEYTKENNALYVIRSKRGKVDEDSYSENGENVKYPGSLITAYPADRELARQRVKYRNGAHLEIYGPGSVWKFVKDTENEGGWKIYSLIGEQTVSDNNKGLKVVGDYVEVAAEPSTFYLKEVSDANDPYALPDVYALCTAPEGGQYVTVSDVNDHGDYFLTLDNTVPTTAADDAASFFIESIGTTHEGANPTQEYIDYAANLHMFKSIEPVLDDEDMEYILAEKKNANNEPYDYTNIGSIAEANEFMGLGEMTASSRAFQRLDGKMIRFVNRMSNFVYTGDYYNSLDKAPRYLYASPEAVGIVRNLTDQNLESIWVVELPESTEQTAEADNALTTTAAARMRQLRLRNLATGAYIKSDLTTGDVAEAQTLTVRRRPSLDGTEFYMALTQGYERNTALMMEDSNEDYPKASDNAVWGANSTFYAHWTPESAVSTTAPTVTLTPADELDTYVLTVAKPAGVTAMSLTGLSGLADVTVEKATNTRELTEPATVTLTTDDEGNITGKIKTQLASATVDNVYTVKLPAALLTMDNNVSPAVEAAVTVPKDPTLSGIREVTAAEKGADVIYDLQGRRVSKAGKGVYIINGVKTLVK